MQFVIDFNLYDVCFLASRFNNSAGGDYSRGLPRLGGRNSFQEPGNNYKTEDQFGKRKHETKTVFSRYVLMNIT